MGYFNQREFDEEMFGRGPGDPDVHGHYPGDPDEKDCLICHPKVSRQNKPPQTSTGRSIGVKL